jgi:hypothetical protein
MNNYFVAVWMAIQAKILILTIMIVLDVLLGIILALIKKVFNWEKLTSYLSSDVLPVIGWLVVVMITLFPKELLPGGITIPLVADVVYATVFLKILASLLKSLADAGILTDLFGKVGIGDSKQG